MSASAPSASTMRTAASTIRAVRQAASGGGTARPTTPRIRPLVARRRRRLVRDPTTPVLPGLRPRLANSVRICDHRSLRYQHDEGIRRHARPRPAPPRPGARPHRRPGPLRRRLQRRRLRPKAPTRRRLAEGPATLQVPADHETIQAAVDAAAPGDLILDRAGRLRGGGRRRDREPHHPRPRPQRRDPRRRLRARERHPVARRRRRRREHDGAQLHVERLLLDRRRRLPRLVPHGVPQRRLRHLRLRLRERPDRQLARLRAAPTPASTSASATRATSSSTTSSPSTTASATRARTPAATSTSSTRRSATTGPASSRTAAATSSATPSRETTVVGNLVHDNNETANPAIDVALLAHGNGILVAGGVRNHDRTQPGVGPRPHRHRPRPVPGGGRQRPRPRAVRVGHPCAVAHDEPVEPIAARGLQVRRRAARRVRGACGTPSENQVIGNVVEGSGVADLAVADRRPVRHRRHHREPRQLLLAATPSRSRRPPTSSSSRPATAPGAAATGPSERSTSLGLFGIARGGAAGGRVPDHPGARSRSRTCRTRPPRRRGRPWTSPARSTSTPSSSRPGRAA